MCRVCAKCKDIFYEGHCIGDGDLYLCSDCVNDYFTDDQLEMMYKNDIQYCSTWTEEDFDSQEEMEEYIKTEKNTDYSETIKSWVNYVQKMWDEELTLCECCWKPVYGNGFTVDDVFMCEDCYQYHCEG